MAEETLTEAAEDESCGKDLDCFKRALRICKKATLTDSNDEGEVTAEITGLEAKKCKFKVKMKKEGVTLDMLCNEQDYAFADFEPKHLSKICSGTLANAMSIMNSSTVTGTDNSTTNNTEEDGTPNDEEG